MVIVISRVVIIAVYCRGGAGLQSDMMIFGYTKFSSIGLSSLPVELASLFPID